MIPLGEADEAELDLAAEPLLEANADPLSAPMPPLERRLILARLVQAWARTVDRTLLPLDAEVPFLVPSSPADAIGLAGDLERLMDALTVEGLPWSEIGAAVEAEYSRYFGLTLDFVKIAAENWPKLLAERGLADPVARARGLLLAEERRLSRGADPRSRDRRRLARLRPRHRPADRRRRRGCPGAPLSCPVSTSTSTPPAGTASTPARDSRG